MYSTAHLPLGAEQLTRISQFGRRVDPHEPQAEKTQVTLVTSGRMTKTWYGVV